MDMKAIKALIICTLSVAVCPALADDAGTISGDKGTDMLVDALLVRPLGVAGIVLGAAATLVSLPFTVTGGNVGETAHYLIVEPAEYTFDRPLGDFYHCGADRHPCGASTR